MGVEKRLLVKQTFRGGAEVHNGVEKGAHGIGCTLGCNSQDGSDTSTLSLSCSRGCRLPVRAARFLDQKPKPQVPGKY